MAFILFVVIVIVFFWALKVNSRLSSLETKIGADVSEPKTVTPPDSSLAEKTVPDKILPPPPPPPAKVDEHYDVAGWFSRIGMVALLFGIGFFLKYAIDQGWVSEWTRVILGIFAGGLLIVLGEIWKTKYSQYAKVLSGGGIAILYFSIFAAYQFYALISQPVGFVLMVFITGLAAVLSYSHRSLHLAMLAVVGAYLAPILMHSNTDQQIPLFIYLSLVNIGVLIVLLKRFWVELFFLALLGTGFGFVLWGMKFSSSENTINSIFFLLFSMLLFYVGSALLLRKHQRQNSLPQKTDQGVGMVYLLAGVFFIIATVQLLFTNFHDRLAITALLEAIIVLAAYLALPRVNFQHVKSVLASSSALLLVLVAFWQFEGAGFEFSIVILGLIGIIVGVLLDRVELRAVGLGVLVLSLLKILFTSYNLAEYRFLFNEKFGLTLLAVLALWFSSWLYSRVKLSQFEEGISDKIKVLAILTLWFGFSWEIFAYFRDADSANARNLLLSLWWIVYAVFVTLYGALTRQSLFRKLAMVLFALSILKVFIYDVQELDLGYRVVSFITLGVILLVISFVYQKNKEKITSFLEGERKPEPVPKRAKKNNSTQKRFKSTINTPILTKLK